jgi:hypothetical protein
MVEQTQSEQLLHRSLIWLSRTLSTSNATHARLILAGAIVFLMAFGVRLLHWQDYRLNIGSKQSSLVSRYHQQAQRMLDGDGILYPSDRDEHASTQLILHPPGYSIFIAGVYALLGKSDDRLVLAQIAGDSLAAMMVFLIVFELLPLTASAIAGLLVAFSPHLAFYALALLPESLSVLPILAAVWLLIRARKKPRLATIIAAGAMIGLSCWLRSNNLLLAPWLALLLIPALFDRGSRIKYSFAFVSAALLVISPITIRNWIVFDRFVPVSLGSGITMIEGIADYDKEDRFGMPASDAQAKWKDVEWHNRPDYSVGLWRPDGIERDRYRFARGLEVIRRNPVWFASVMVRRAASMLRYNDSIIQGWPADTAHAPILAAEPPFGHQLAVTEEPVWSTAPAETLGAGKVLSPQAECVLGDAGLTVRGDNSDYGDQFVSAPIAVHENTDYVLRVPVSLFQGRVALRITSVDRRIMLASYVPATYSEAEEDESRDDDAGAGKNAITEAVLPFATGARTDVLLVVSNNGAAPVASQINLGQADLFEQGPTPGVHTRLLRAAVRGVERNLYTTSHLLSLIAAGIVLMALARRWRLLLILLAVPAYYLVVQSTLHTEYRYILTLHYFLFVMAAVTLACVVALITRVLSSTARAIKSKGPIAFFF